MASRSPGWRKKPVTGRSKRSQVRGYGAAQPSGAREIDEGRRTLPIRWSDSDGSELIFAAIERDYSNRLLSAGWRQMGLFQRSVHFLTTSRRRALTLPLMRTYFSL